MLSGCTVLENVKLNVQTETTWICYASIRILYCIQVRGVSIVPTTAASKWDLPSVGCWEKEAEVYTVLYQVVASNSVWKESRKKGHGEPGSKRRDSTGKHELLKVGSSASMSQYPVTSRSNPGRRCTLNWTSPSDQLMQHWNYM